MRQRSLLVEVTIARAGRWTVTTAAAIGVILGTRKDLLAIAINLNGWHVLAALSGLVLIVVLGDSYRLWLQGKFTRLEKMIHERDAALPGYVKTSVTEFLDKQTHERKA
jgi:uncharacterized membrane protein